MSCEGRWRVLEDPGCCCAANRVPQEPARPFSWRGRAPRTEEAGISKRTTPHQETVSLIDRKRPAKKSQEGETKTKRTVLPPISRIRASLEATSKPPPAHVPPAEPPPPEPAEQPPAEAASTPAEVEAGPQQKVLLIKPPIVVKHFANELGLKPHQLIAELMTHKFSPTSIRQSSPILLPRLRKNTGSFWKKSGGKKAAAFTRWNSRWSRRLLR